MATTVFTFHVTGMHCRACETLLEHTLSDAPGITSVKASLKDRTLSVTTETGDSQTPEALAARLTELVKGSGYTLSAAPTNGTRRFHEFLLAAPIAVALTAGFVLLQRAQLVNLIGGEVTAATAFTVGLIASVSTCLAVVGGLVLSVGATAAKSGSPLRSQVLFHAGRLAGFFALGGAIGAAGSAFHLSATATFTIQLLVSVVMLVLGINLLDIFHGAKRLQLTLPKAAGHKVLAVSKLEHAAAPLLAGAATFFLPCGFTQSMQLYALTTGSFSTGAVTMFVFALGTLPVLALLSFGSFSFHSKPYAGVFYKTAGLVVLALATLSLTGALASRGIIPPLINL